MDGVGSVLARNHVSMGGMSDVCDVLACVVWAGWVMCLCGWHASVIGMSGVVTWMACDDDDDDDYYYY